MQGYEIIFIFDPNMTEDDQTAFLDKLKETAEGNGAEWVHCISWGRRKLAYQVKKRDYGIYYLLYISRAPEAVKAMETSFRHDENLIKWQNVAVENIEEEHTAFIKLKTEGSISHDLSER